MGRGVPSVCPDYTNDKSSKEQKLLPPVFALLVCLQHELYRAT